MGAFIHIEGCARVEIVKAYVKAVYMSKRRAAGRVFEKLLHLYIEEVLLLLGKNYCHWRKVIKIIEK